MRNGSICTCNARVWSFIKKLKKRWITDYALPFSLIERQDSFPKYNIYRENSEVTDEFTVELSLAGYPKDQLKVYTNNHARLFVYPYRFLQ